MHFTSTTYFLCSPSIIITFVSEHCFWSHLWTTHRYDAYALNSIQLKQYVQFNSNGTPDTKIEQLLLLLLSTTRDLSIYLIGLDWIHLKTNAWPQPPRKEQERRCRWNLLLLILQIIMLQICIRSYVCHFQKTRVAPICAFIVYFGNALVYGFFKLRSCSCTKTPFSSSSSWFYL
jgi:hypothetical protein